MKSAALSVDIDSLHCYAAIHGLADQAGQDPVLRTALPRFLALCERVDCRATIFVVGRDLHDATYAAIIKDAAGRGHEIASHSYHHDYALSRAAPAQIEADLVRAEEAIERVTGAPPRGFRAPGYNQSEVLMQLLEQRDYLYDSSFFPSPLYYAARASALLRYRIAGRPSRSLVGSIREFAAASSPFHPAVGARHRRAEKKERSRSVVELPITAPLGAPLLGTTIALWPRALSSLLRRASRVDDFVVEFHGIDFLRADEVPPQIARHQPEMRVDDATKEKRIAHFVQALADRRSFATMSEIAIRVAKTHIA